MPLNGNSSVSQKRRWWGTGFSILGAVLILAAFVSRRDDSIPVRIAHVEQGQIRSLISTNGKIEPVQNFEAHSPLTTTVKRVLVKESDAVRKGQLLVTLDDADARTQAARALTQLKAALAEVNAMERGGSQEEVLSLDAQMVKARGDREGAQRNLDALKRLQQQGSASAGEVRAAENALAQADAQLNLLQQKRIRRYSQPKLAPGNPIEITWDAVPGRVWQATVNAVPSTVKLRGSRNVGETISIVDNKDMKLLPNVNVGVTIATAQRDNALVVPREAVRMDDSKPYVLQVVGHQLKRKDVETAISNLTQVEITHGLSLNDTVAISSSNGKTIGDGTQDRKS